MERGHVEYVQGFKARMVQRMAGPRGRSATALSKETGVPQPTLSRWLRAASTLPQMNNADSRSEDTKTPKRWTPEEKLRVVLAAARLPEEQVGELLRREGLHSAQLEDWRGLVLGSLATKPSSKGTPEAKRIKELERELLRKDRALAEVAALLALKKRAQEIWGDGDESTPPRNET